MPRKHQGVAELDEANPHAHRTKLAGLLHKVSAPDKLVCFSLSDHLSCRGAPHERRRSMGSPARRLWHHLRLDQRCKKTLILVRYFFFFTCCPHIRRLSTGLACLDTALGHSPPCSLPSCGPLPGSCPSLPSTSSPLPLAFTSCLTSPQTVRAPSSSSFSMSLLC